MGKMRSETMRKPSLLSIVAGFFLVAALSVFWEKLDFNAGDGAVRSAKLRGIVEVGLY